MQGYGFSDDELDDLPINTLCELEATAIRSTQYQKPASPAQDYYVDGDEVVNLDDESVASRSLLAPQRFREASLGNNDESAPSLDQLVARIHELENENTLLARSMNEHKSAAISKAGETDIVRRRLEKSAKDHDRSIAAMQQAHSHVVAQQAQSLARQKAELDQMRRDREQAQTNHLFLEHDLAREAGRAAARRPKRTTTKETERMSSRGPGHHDHTEGAVTTPKKSKTLPFRDGFDDEDMAMVSPSKARDQSKATPKQANKRKRQAAEQSPAAVLQLGEPPAVSREPAAPDSPKLDAALLEKLGSEAHRFDTLRRLLNHRCAGGQNRIFEVLTRFALPSHPERMLSTMALDGMARCSQQHNPSELALQYCNVFLSLWGECLREAYYCPILALVDAVHFLLACEQAPTAVSIMDRALPLILASVDLVAIPIARISTDPTFVIAHAQRTQIELRRNIDVFACLDLLYTIATSCAAVSSSSRLSASPDAAHCFWQHMPADFVLLMLMKAQPLGQIVHMLRIMHTSALPGSFGAIVAGAPGQQQARREADTIERLTLLLFEMPIASSAPSLPSPARTTSPHTPQAVAVLRLEVLSLLRALALHPQTTHTLAHHRTCLARLVHFLHDSLSSLYTPTLSRAARDPTVAAVNATMRLLYHLLTATPDLDVKAKLAAVPGASHKFLVVLARLAFSEMLVLEHGIEMEAVDAAHAVLDRGLSPEEGEALLRVFGGGSAAGAAASASVMASVSEGCNL